MRTAAGRRPPGAIRAPVLKLMLAVIVATAMLVPASAQARSARDRFDAVERRVIRLINRERAQHGLARVRPNRRLRRAADHHSRDMMRAKFFAHASRNGTPAVLRVGRFRRARHTGETLAHLRAGIGEQAARIVAMWLDSPGHRAVLLDRRFRRVGVARRTGTIGGAAATVVTADFQSRR